MISISTYLSITIIVTKFEDHHNHGIIVNWRCAFYCPPCKYKTMTRNESINMEIFGVYYLIRIVSYCTVGRPTDLNSGLNNNSCFLLPAWFLLERCRITKAFRKRPWKITRIVFTHLVNFGAEWLRATKYALAARTKVFF